MEKFEFLFKSFEHNAPSWVLIISEMEASEFSSVQFNKTLKAAKSQKFLNKLINTNNTTLLNARLKMQRWKIDDIWTPSIYFAQVNCTC